MSIIYKKFLRRQNKSLNEKHKFKMIYMDEKLKRFAEKNIKKDENLLRELANR